MNTALMSKTCRNIGLLCLSVLFLMNPAVIQADQSPAFHFKSGLLLENAGIYGRRPIYTDAVVQKIITGTWQPPTEGQTLKLAGDNEKTWKTMSGIFQVRPGAHTIDFKMNSASSATQRNDGTLTIFDDVGIYVYDTLIEAETARDEYMLAHPEMYEGL